MKAVILAAGEGKRLRPLTFTRPKCMINIAGKPILEHILESLKAAGITEVFIVVKYIKEKIIDYFGDGKRLGMKITYIEQGSNYGTGAAFLTAKEHIDETFFGMAGDIITEASAIKKLIQSHSGSITLGLKEVDHPQEYGIAVLKGDTVANFVEKPAKPISHLANCSLYVMEPEILKEIQKLKSSERGEYEITDVIKALIPEKKVTGLSLSEYWLDMGMPWQLFDANEFILNKTKERTKGIENCNVKGKVIVEEGAHVFDSYIEGPVYIGKNTRVGPHAYLRGATSIGDNCDIGDSTTIKNSIIFNYVNAKHLTYIGDSIIGENCNFGAATQIANYRFDEGKVKTTVNEQLVTTNRTKLGAIIGDNTKTGVLSSIMPGRMIGDNCWIGAGVVVVKNIPSNTSVVVKQELIYGKRTGE